MREATHKTFKTPKEVTNFINEHGIKQQNIIAISTGRAYITLYYYV